jgi:hypothetical protein
LEDELVSLEGLIEGDKPTPKQEESDGGAGNGSPSDSDSGIESMLDAAASALSGEEPEVEEVEEKQEAKPKSEEKVSKDDDKRTAQGRIRELAAKAKDAEARSAAREQEFTQKFQQAQRQFEQKLQQTQQENYQYQKQVYDQYQQTMQEMNRIRGIQEEKTLQPHEKFQRDIVSKARSEAEQIARQQFEPLQQQLQQYQAREAQAKQHAERQARYGRFQQMSQEALDKVVYSQIDPEFRSDIDAEKMKDFLLTYATAFSKEPQAAAAEFQELLNKLNRASLKTRAKKQGTLVAKNQTAPKAAPAGQVSPEGYKQGKNGPVPSKELLAFNSHKSYADWMFAGKPALRPLSKR